jgi:hypothetical protein
MPVAVCDGQLARFVQLADEFLNEEGVSTRSRVDLLKQLTASPAARKHRPNQLVAIRAREGLQVETLAEARSYGGVDHPPKLRSSLHLFLTHRPNQQPWSSHRELGEVAQQLEAVRVEVM